MNQRHKGLQAPPIRVPLYLALVHHPVVNRNQEVIASAVTNLDLHDLARLVRTYDLPGCFIVTPLQDQQQLARELVAHWCEGVGRELHPHRWQALERLRIVDDIGAACTAIQNETGTWPRLWATSARPHGVTIGHEEARQSLFDSGSQNGLPYLLLLGTAWGLAPGVVEACDAVLASIPAASDYNHLSVRCAAAILVDRLASRDRRNETQ